MIWLVWYLCYVMFFFVWFVGSKIESLEINLVIKYFKMYELCLYVYWLYNYLIYI